MSSSILVSLAAWLVVRTSIEAGPEWVGPGSRAVGPAQPFSRRTSSPMITRCFYVLGCGGGKCQTIDAPGTPPWPQTGHYTKTTLLPNESRSPALTLRTGDRRPHHDSPTQLDTSFPTSGWIGFPRRLRRLGAQSSTRLLLPPTPTPFPHFSKFRTAPV